MTAETIDSVFYLFDVASGDVLYISPAYERVWEQSCESLRADSHSYLQRVHPGDVDLATRLRARRPGLKVLFTSGYTEDTLVLQDLDPAQAFLPKPYLPAALTDRVRALLDLN